MQAADHFYDDFEEALDRLRLNAEGYSYYEDEKMAAIGYRKIHFKNLNYKIFYRVKGDVVYIDMVCHDLQNHRKALRNLRKNG